MHKFCTAAKLRTRLTALVLTVALAVAALAPAAFAADSSDFTITDGVLTGYTGPGGDVTIPNSVTSIGNSAFSGCSSLTIVTIPQGVTSIGNSAFSYCSALTSVTIPDGVTSIGNSAFQGCSSLTSVTIPQGVTSIETFTFYGCTSLVSVTIPDGVTIIEPFAFENCSALTSVTIPQGVTRICQQAFSGCTSLASVTIPNSVTIIDPFAFSGCTSMTSLTILYGVTSIGEYAFQVCTSLTSVTIPQGVTSIEPYAFYDCTSLTSVTFQGDYPATVGAGVFSGNNNLNSLLYPYGNASWAGKTAAGLGAPSTAKLLPYAQAAVSASTESTDLSSGSAVLAVTSSTIPFDPTQAEKLENYTISGGGQISLTSAGVDGTDAKTVRLTFQLPAARAARASISADIEIAPSAFAGVIVDETGSPVGPVTVPAAFSTPDPTYTVTVRYLYADGSQAAQPYTAVLANGAAYSVPSPAIAGYTPDKATVSGTVAGGNVEITVTYQPSNTGPVGPGSSGSDSGSSGGSGRPGTTPTKPPNQPPALTDAVSPIQNDAIQTGNIQRPNWIDRLTLPDYGRTLYDVMSGKTPGSQGQTRGLFEIQDHFKLAPKTTRKPMYRVNRIEEVEFSVLSPYSGGTSLDSTIFQDERFFTITPDAQDQAINYAGLTMGSFISTANFNGVYVTKLSYDAMTDAAKKETCEYIAAVFHAFDKDCPEIFWLSGKCKVRIVTVTNPDTKAKESYFFLVLADKDGFTMCAPAWTQSGSIAAGIARRDAAVSKILETVTAAAPVDQVKQLNKWLTENNQYNTSADLTAISNEPHECLAALEGRIAADGPVCDGYSRAFKVLCDRLGISCVLETGWAKATTGAAPQFHMWDLVQMDETWYGVDVTWNDPSVKDFVGAKSGRENENFLLVGADTVILDLPFNVSHEVKNQAAAGGVDFNNGPILSPVAYYSSLEYGPLFSDVPSGSWYAGAVNWAVERGITYGTSQTTFSPDLTCTQVQILTFLWRAAGQPASSAELPFTLDAGLDYAEGALRWACEKGMIGAGFDPAAPCARSDAVTFIWQAAGAPEGSSGSAFTDVAPDAGCARAVAWAVNKGITAGTSQTAFTPDRVCTRAEAVTFLYRDRKENQN